MKLDIPDEVIEAAALSPEEILRILAVVLYDRERLSVGYASRLAALSHADFLDLLSAEGVDFKYDAEDLREDMRNLEDL